VNSFTSGGLGDYTLPLLFDQACSAAAFVNIAHAASTGSDIPRAVRCTNMAIEHVMPSRR
jgi:Malate/L-lactate dehydrogenases